MQLCRSWLEPGLLVSAVMVLTVLGVNPREEDGLKNARHSEEGVKKVLDSLNRAQRQQEIMERREEYLINITINEKFSWVNYTDGLPNFFLQDERDALENSYAYRESAMVYVGNKGVSECIKKIVEKKQLSVSDFVDSEARAEWERRNNRGNLDKTDQDFKFHVGDFTFGLCQGRGKEKCAYFITIEDPFQRAIRTYELCKRERSHPVCSLLDAKKVTLLQWTVHHGNYLLHQLSFHGNYCDANVENIPHKYKHVTDKEDLPCWFKQKLKMEENISDADFFHLTSFIVRNLEKWFAAVGLQEDLENSGKIFQHVLQLPFTKCFSEKVKNAKSQVDFSHDDDNNNRVNRKPKRTLVPEDEGYDYENDPNVLRYDFRIEKALEADKLIYKQAQRIFRLQKQRLLNKTK
ncbi:uncharacterized protein LOC106166348 [Lingula anatina]|uniref:Uncharacterized protein LOC106166348 n=1 Tax=Lingula anatina TaxID=7574 RepID=A0A1S3IQ44_LINAN|nr:uncharacterized protein LOC106166348 [Lingula anatina]|eukprot:XP_013400337.1 uncharacterized protein LOC106166348 [Lingula anatina]